MKVSDAKKARDKIQDAENELEDLHRRYLKARGWEFTCATPGSYWMWTKVIDGKAMYVNENMAMDMQDRIDSNDPAWDEEPTNG